MAIKKINKRLNQPFIKRFVNQYLPTIRNLYAPQQVWLFGSYAHGRPQRWSDLDLLVVSQKFSRGKRTRRRSNFLVKTGIWNDHEFIVDPLCYTPTEFERWKDAPTIISEVVKTGIRLV
jgi:predicted nucleotidyltransferase